MDVIMVLRDERISEEETSRPCDGHYGFRLTLRTLRWIPHSLINNQKPIGIALGQIQKRLSANKMCHFVPTKEHYLRNTFE